MWAVFTEWLIAFTLPRTDAHGAHPLSIRSARHINSNHQLLHLTIEKQTFIQLIHQTFPYIPGIKMLRIICVFSKSQPLNIKLTFSNVEYNINCFEVRSAIRRWTTYTTQLLLRKGKKKKLKWSRYRPGVAQRIGRGIALLFHDRGTRRGWVVKSTPRPHITPGKDPVPILQEAGWAPGPVWTGGKSRSHMDSIPDRPVCNCVMVSEISLQFINQRMHI